MKRNDESHRRCRSQAVMGTRVDAILVVLATLCLAAGCTATSDDAQIGDPALRFVERGLERAYYNRFVHVAHRGGRSDTLLVRFQGGRDLLGGGPGRDGEFRAAAHGVAVTAARLAGPVLGRCGVVTVEFQRSRRFGPLVFDAGKDRATFPAAELREADEGPAAACDVSVPA